MYNRNDDSFIAEDLIDLDDRARRARELIDSYTDESNLDEFTDEAGLTDGTLDLLAV